MAEQGLFGSLVTGALGGFNKKPEVPTAPNVNPQVAQQQAVSGNIAALPGLEDLAGQTNQFNVGQRQAMAQQAIPGYAGLTGGASDVLSGWINGALSPDVASAIRRNTNARAFAGGYGGSGMGENLTARDLGLTSLDLQKMGISALPSYLNTTASIGMPKQFDPTSMFMSPSDVVSAEQWNQTQGFSRDWLANQIKAIADPETAAIAQGFGSQADAIGSSIPYFGSVYSKGVPSQGGGSSGGGMGGGGMDMGSIMSLASAFM